MQYNRQFQIQTPVYYQNQQMNQITSLQKRPHSVQQQSHNVLRQLQYNQQQQQHQYYQPNIQQINQQQINQQKQQNMIQPPVQKQSVQQQVQPKQIPQKIQAPSTPIPMNPQKNQNQQQQIPTNQQKQMHSNIKKLDTYEIFLNKVLGEGQFGIVYLACNKDENNQMKYYAVKMIKKIQKQMLIREIDLLNKAKHENLISLHEMKTTHNNIYLFLDYCNGGNLRQFLTKNKGRLAEDQAMQFFIQLCAGYKQLYSQNIVHRDLKPENILLNDGNVKIGDYGFGKIIDGDMNAQMKLTKLGTPVYASPQVLLGNPYSSKTDIWSMGVILFEMLYGQKPFNGNNELFLIRDMEIKTKDKNFLCSNSVIVSPQIQDLISRMLRFQEEDRISWEELFSHQVINYQNALLNQNAGDYEEDELDLYKSICENRKTIKGNIVIDHPTVNNINYIQTNQEDDPESNYQLFKKQQEITYSAQQTHQLFLLIRNKALFSNVTLQWFWEFSQKLDTSRILCKAIVFCCGGYYYYSILELKNIFQNLVKQDYVSEENFQIYKIQKLYFEQAYQHILNDFIQAENFFVPFRKYVFNELSKQIARYRQQADKDEELVKYLDEFINFVYAQSQSPMAYTLATQNLLKKIIKSIQINQLGFHQMKTIHAVQIFSQIDKFLPLKNFLQIDLRKFYDQNLVNIQLEELKKNVIQQTSLLLSGKDNSNNNNIRII